MWDRVTVQAKPTSWPLTVDEIKLHLRIDQGFEDAKLAQFIYGAVALIDGPDGIGFAMLEQTWRLTLDAFPYDVIELPGAPVKSVSAVSYVDTDGVTQTIDPTGYQVGIGVDPVRVAPAYGTAWPASRAVFGSVTIDYVLGEAMAADVPADLLDAVSMIVGHRYENREAAAINVSIMPLPFGVDYILSKYRRNLVAS